MKKIAIIALCSLLRGLAVAEDSATKIPAHCLGKSSFVPMPTTCVDAQGNKIETGLQTQAAYLRVHPSGNYAIATSTELGKAVILDLRNWRRNWEKRNGAASGGRAPEVPCIVTPLSAEAYPVEPNWDLVSSNDRDAMKYYRFEDLLKMKDTAAPVLADAEHNEYYQSHARVKRDAYGIEFKTMLYTNLKSRTYRMKYDSTGKLVAAERDAKGPIEDLNAGERLEGVSTPVLSKDGQFLAVHTNSTGVTTGATQKIFSLADPHNPVLVADIGYATGKPSFAYPEKHKGPVIAFADMSFNVTATAKHGEFMPSHIELYNSTTKTTQLSSFPWLEQDAAYPNFTLDKHLVYVAKRDGKMGLVETIPVNYPKADGDKAYLDCFEHFDKRNFEPEAPAHSRRDLHSSESLQRYLGDGRHGDSFTVREDQKLRLIRRLTDEQRRMGEKIRRLPTREDFERLQQKLDRLQSPAPASPPPSP